MIKYIDIHSHLGFEDYGQDLKDVIKRMKESGVITITIGTDLESSKEAVKIASEYENIYACIGAHPVDKKDFIFNESDFESLVKNPKVVAIGECGLDYFVNPKFKVEGEKLKGILDEEKERQKKEFIKQIEFSIKHNKPLMLHIRNAYEDSYEILKKYNGKVRGNVHFFTGSSEWAQKFHNIGFTVSFPGVITFAKECEEAVKNIPLDMIHVETDSPYASPIPFRGKRNEPTYVTEIVKKIAEVRGEDYEKVRIQLLKNANRVFGIKV
jgi:TatD DNase family protein